MNKTELNNTALGGPATQTPEQKSIIEQIKAKRAKVPDNPAMTARSSYHRGDADTKGGYQNAGKTVTKLENPYSDPKSRQVWDAINQEISNEGGISAVNTYDDAWVTLGSGFAGVLLSRVMEEFLSKDEAARNMFLDVGVTFADGKLRIVNTDNGAIEEDKLTGGGGARNAQMIFALSKPVLNLFTSIAETEGHAKIMQGAERDQTLGLKFTPKVAENWSDMMAVRLVAHLIHFRPYPNWPRYESCNGNVKQILGVVAPVIKKAYRDPKMGNAYVIDSGQTAVLFAMAHGKAKEALDSPAPMAIPADTPAGSLQNVLLMQSPGDATKYYKVTLP